MNTAQIIPFCFESHEVRTVLIDEQPWFVAMDIAGTLQYTDTQAMTRKLDEDEIQTRQIVGFGNRGATLINESGLYSAILRSRKSEAKRFKKWVTSEVLPAIRKHGRYDDSKGKMNTLIGQTIGTDGFHCLGAVLDGKVRQLPVKARQRAKMHVWSQVHKAFSVVSAQDIPASQLNSARNFIAAYALEGEWLGKDEPKDGVYMAGADLYLVYFLCRHFDALRETFHRYKMYEGLNNLGSPAGSAMVEHFTDGAFASTALLRNYGAAMDDYQRAQGLNRYRS